VHNQPERKDDNTEETSTGKTLQPAEREREREKTFRSAAISMLLNRCKLPEQEKSRKKRVSFEPENIVSAIITGPVKQDKIDRRGKNRQKPEGDSKRGFQ
jgi:hypothetical protein